MQGWRAALLSLLVVFSFAGCEYESPARTAKVEKPKVPAKAPGPVDPDAPEEFSTTESGLKYRIRRKSEGEKPTKDQMVYVDYRAWLEDGTIFETTYGTAGTPATLQLNSDPAHGRAEGIQLVGVGGMIELEVPATEGVAGRPGLPKLHYLIELLKAMDAPKASDPSLPPSTPSANATLVGKVDDDAPEEFTTTASGLKYRIRRKSDGKKPTAANSVKVHYKGWLDDGKQFDSSYDRGQPIDFGLSQVVPGWTEGLQLVGTGGMIELEIPSKLGYGPSGKPPVIPPDSTLHFIVELLDVK
ncbi:MAG TPA: FKBP-type peptidyl-prolyl cis-trans isomerase [Schlesneria sp.]|jgi:FKBP-type peptidyl-prolyl cis-trans isomerase